MLRILSFMFAFTLAGAAVAGPLYAVVGFGQASADTPSGDAALSAQGFTNVRANKVGGASSSFTIGAGYVVRPRVAVEATYVQLKEPAHYAANFTAGANEGINSKVWNAKGFGLHGVVSLWTWDEVTFYGKAGLYALRGEQKSSTVITDPITHATVSSASDTTSGSGVVPSIGAGAALAFTERLQLRVFYELIGKKSGMFGAGNDLGAMRLLTGAVVLSF